MATTRQVDASQRQAHHDCPNGHCVLKIFRVHDRVVHSGFVQAASIPHEIAVPRSDTPHMNGCNGPGIIPTAPATAATFPTSEDKLLHSE